MRITSTSGLKAVGVTTVGIVVLFAASAVASIPSPNGTIYGCYAKTTGATRIIDPGSQKCTASEQPISWSQRGPRGPQGEQGLRGPRGPAGADGTDGTDGVSGYEQVSRQYLDQTLPIDDAYFADCPTGKKVLGGGVIIQLYNDAGFVNLGEPARYNKPNGDDEWAAYIIQPATGGATKANITFDIVCATAAP